MAISQVSQRTNTFYVYSNNKKKCRQLQWNPPIAHPKGLIQYNVPPPEQEAMILGDVSYHDYHGIALTDEEKDALQKSIGPYNKVSICP